MMALITSDCGLMQVYNEKMDGIRQYLSAKKVPTGVRRRVIHFYTTLWTGNAVRARPGLQFRDTSCGCRPLTDVPHLRFGPRRSTTRRRSSGQKASTPAVPLFKQAHLLNPNPNPECIALRGGGTIVAPDAIYATAAFDNTY